MSCNSWISSRSFNLDPAPIFSQRELWHLIKESTFRSLSELLPPASSTPPMHLHPRQTPTTNFPLPPCHCEIKESAKYFIPQALGRQQVVQARIDIPRRNVQGLQVFIPAITTTRAIWLQEQRPASPDILRNIQIVCHRHIAQMYNPSDTKCAFHYRGFCDAKSVFGLRYSHFMWRLHWPRCSGSLYPPRFEDEYDYYVKLCRENRTNIPFGIYGAKPLTIYPIRRVKCWDGNTDSFRSEGTLTINMAQGVK